MPSPVAHARLDKWLGLCAGLLAVLGSLGLIALVGVTGTAVFARYVLNDPIFGIDDVSSMLLTVVAAAALIYGARHQAHVSVNVLTMFAGRRVTRVTDAVMRLLGVAVVGLAAFALFWKGRCGFECGAFTPNIEIPHPPFYYLMGVVMALYTLQLLLHLIVGLAHFGTADPNEISD